MQSLLNLDQAISNITNQWLGRSALFDFIIKAGSEFTVYVIPVLLLVLWFGRKPLKELAMFATGAGFIAWLAFSNLIGMLWFRERPFIDGGVQELVFHRPDKSFPSDHAAFMMAVTWIAFRFGYKRLGWWLLMLDVVMGFCRVVAGIHYTGDILAGFAIGLVTAEIIYRFKKPLAKYVVDPLMKFLVKIKLSTQL